MFYLNFKYLTGFQMTVILVSYNNCVATISFILKESCLLLYNLFTVFSVSIPGSGRSRCDPEQT